MTLKKSFPILSSAILSLTLCACGTTEGSNTDGGDDVDGGLDVCQRDDSQKASTAVEWQLIPDGEPATGYICPKRDVDHFWFEVTQPRSIVAVSLSNNVLASTVQLCFDIYKQGEDIRYGGECDNDSTDGKTSLNSTWYLEEAGIYFIEVRDDRGDTEDARALNNYMLSIGVVQDKDEYEPNDSAAQAKTLASGQGYISYREDEDWYQVEVSKTGQILLLDLTNTAKTEVDLRYEVFMPDGSTRINAGEDSDGMKDDQVSLHDSLALAEAGTYYIKVSDVGGDDTDLDLGYSLSVSTRDNPDARDRSGAGNEEWATATPITSGSTVNVAYLATRGDDDWYVIESAGVDDVNPALLEIDLVFDNASPIEPVINLLVADPHTPCAAGDACGELVGSCSGCDIECMNAQCASHECLTHLNKCKGSGECLDGGSYWGCGINSLFMYGVDWSETGNAKHLHTVAPMYGERYYFRVSDYQSKRFDADHAYALTVTVRPEKDVHEVPPNGLYLPYMTEAQENASREWNKRLATPINCTDSGSEIVCGPIEGYLSYRGDQDWFVMSRNGGPVVPDLAEANPVKKSVSVDWDLQVDWAFTNGKSGMPVGIFIDPGRQTPMGPEVTAGSGTWGIAPTDRECSYFCGEYHTPDSFYLWVFNDTFHKYDYEHPYRVTIRLVKGCPSNCPYCADDRCEYGCPTSTNPDPEENCP